MKTVNIAGAGGIGKAAALIALNTYGFDVKVVIGDRDEKALKAAKSYVHNHPNLETYIIHDGDDEALHSQFQRSDVVLDCLPGSLAPRVAKMARRFNCHYANLTEYVDETNEIKGIAANARTGFVLQTGLAPGYINILGLKLFNDFCEKYGVEEVIDIEMKVGALTKTAIAPHFYGFTWSPIGVATEYVKDAVVLRDHQVVKVPALSEIQKLMIGGDWYEANFTSGGAADLPSALKDKVKNLDYRTLRFPGHYEWVKEVLQSTPQGVDAITYLQDIMLSTIPQYDDDMVVLYAHVTGLDRQGRLRRLDKNITVEASFLAGQKLTAIQSTTAAPLIEVARMLLTDKYKGVVLQSMIDPDEFISGPVVSKVYGND